MSVKGTQLSKQRCCSNSSFSGLISVNIKYVAAVGFSIVRIQHRLVQIVVFASLSFLKYVFMDLDTSLVSRGEKPTIKYETNLILTCLVVIK